MAAPKPVLTPHGYFRRWIEGSDFSLESNTPAAPSQDIFYVLAAGEVHLGTSDFKAATVDELKQSRNHRTRQFISVGETRVPQHAKEGRCDRRAEKDRSPEPHAQQQQA